MWPNAEAICEVDVRQNLWFASVKTREQQACFRAASGPIAAGASTNGIDQCGSRITQ